MKLLRTTNDPARVQPARPARVVDGCAVDHTVTSIDHDPLLDRVAFVDVSWCTHAGMIVRRGDRRECLRCRQSIR